MPEILRQRQDAELALSNAIADLSEACTVLRQYMPEYDHVNDQDPAYPWRHQIKKLRMANRHRQQRTRLAHQRPIIRCAAIAVGGGKRA